VEDYEKLKSKGVDVIACLAANDAFVMSAWGQACGAEGKIHMFADPSAEFAKQTNLVLDLPAVFGAPRYQRFSMLVEDGVVKKLNVEPGPGVTCTLANKMLDMI